MARSMVVTMASTMGVVTEMWMECSMARTTADSMVTSLDSVMASLMVSSMASY